MSIKNQKSKPANKVKKEKPKEVVRLKETQSQIIASNFQEVAILEERHKVLRVEHEKALKTRNESIISIVEGAGFDPSKIENIDVNFETKEITFDIK